MDKNLNQIENLTEEFILNEIKKCKEDPIYFLTNYGYIIHPSKGKIKFELFDYQKKHIEAILNHKYIIVDKARQLGISTTTAGLCLWYAVFHPNKEIAIVSINDKEAMYFLGRVKFLYDECPVWLVGKLVKDTEHILKFDNNSFIEVLATTKRALRGRSPALAIIDEIAFNQFADEMMTSAMPSLIHGEHIVLISTRNGTEGIGAYFYQMLEKAKAKENDFFVVEIDWWECPLYNPKAPQYVDWRENEWAMSQYKLLGESKFRQEILREWILSEATVLPQRVLDNLIPRTPIRTDFIKEIDITPEEVYNLPESGWDSNFLYAKGLWIWKEPKEGHYYTMGVDIATGRAQDYTAIEIIDINEMEQVAEYRYKIPLNFLPELIYKLALYYNNAFIGIETNFDEGTINKLIEFGYENIYYRTKKDKIIAGWHTDAKTRAQLVSHLQDTFINERIKIYSQRLISELRTFIWRNGKPQCALKSTDDLVFAFMIADYIIETCILNLGLDIEVKSDKEKKKEQDNLLLIPSITTEVLNINSKEIENEKEDVFENSGEINSELEDLYEINTEFYPFVGLQNKPNQ